MGSYSKFIGAVVGAVSGFLVARFGLPAEWATPEMQGAVTVFLSGIVTYLFPANAA